MLDRSLLTPAELAWYLRAEETKSHSTSSRRIVACLTEIARLRALVHSCWLESWGEDPSGPWDNSQAKTNLFPKEQP